jgi:hypothetical protein
MKLVAAERIGTDNVTEAELIEAFQDEGSGEFIILSQRDQGVLLEDDWRCLSS